jgi:chaperonin GroEL
MAKIVIHSDEARRKLLEGAQILAKAVVATLGPKGRNVVIAKDFGGPDVTKDGVTVAEAVSELKDPVMNVGASIIREAATNTNDSAGDGTTTAILLASAMMQEGMKNVAAGANPMDIRRGIEKAAKIVVEKLTESAKQIDSKEETAQVATVSTNHDEELGNMIAEVMDKVGKDGVVTVEESNDIRTSVDYVEGMQFDRGYLSPYFVTDKDTLEASLEDPAILITDQKLSNVNDIQPIAERILQNLKQPLVIVAEDIEGQALATLVYNKLRGVIKVLAIKAPGFGDRRKQMLQDLAALTGANVISEETGRTLESIDMEDLGKAKKVISDKENTTVVGSDEFEDAVEERVAQIKKEIDLATSDYDKEKLQERMAKLSGGVAVINVGGVTETELQERKYRVEDALNATRAALAEGIVAGGGVALLRVTDSLKEVEDLRGDEEVGVEIVRKALHSPVHKIAENAGKNGELIASQCKDSKGYDARNDEFVDMFKAGIVDPAKVTKSAVLNASSVAAMLLTNEAVVVENPEDEEEEAAPAGGAPGMGGGMGGMGMM